jgi:hypothetical protein
MAAIKRECPYKTKAEIEAAILKAGSVDALSLEAAASPSTIRRWCKLLGASTRSGKIGAERVACPYTDVAELEQALEEAGTFVELVRREQVAPNTVRRWFRDFGVEPNTAPKKRERAEILDDVKDHELEALVAAMGAERLAEVFGVSRSYLYQITSQRNISSRGIAASPRVRMLSRRIKDLEQQEHTITELRQTIAEAAELVATEPPTPLPKIKARRDRSEVDVILHVSDKQYGMLVDPDEVPGGAYSPELYEERLERYILAVDALLENTAAANPIGTLWIAQGGDFVEGDDVFKGHTWHLAIDAGEQVVRLGRIWAAALQRISARARQVGARQIAVVSVVGNHGVKGGRSAGAVPPSLNYDFLTYELVRSQLEGTGAVDYYNEEARSAVYFQTCGGIVLLTHGEQDKGGGLIGVPVVTGMRNSLTAMVSTGVRPVLHLSGHFHRPAQISLSSDLMRIWSGPWVGQTNLSIGRGGASSPSQHMLVMHPEHGMIAQHVIRMTGAVESPVEVVRL